MPSSNLRPLTKRSRLLALTRLAALLPFIILMLNAVPSIGTSIGEYDHSSHISSQSALAPDFSISATSPTAANVNQSADSTIIINAINSFVGSVSIVGNPSYGLTCGSIVPPEVRGSGVAIVSCSATTAGEYNLTLTGASGSLTHTTTATFNFVDFKIVASSPTGAVGASLSSTISIVAINGFPGKVTITAVPQSGLTCGSITPSDITSSGTATISCSATSVGEYILTVHGTSSSLSHSVGATFDVANLPNFSIVVISPTPVNAGQQATSTITVEELNGFTDTVTLADAISSDLTCQMIIPTAVLGSGTATVSCSSNKAGDYTLAITGTSNSLSHSATATFNFMDFTIAARSPATSNVGSTVSSNFIIGSLNGFVGTVSLTDFAPTGLTCDAITPNNVLSSGTALILCNANTAGTYVITVSATSGSLTHSVSAAFIFTAASPDFTIAATPSVSFTSGSTGTSTVTISGQNGFDLYVTLSYQITPSHGLTVALNPATIYPGESTATFSSTTPGLYTVTITGTDGVRTRTAMISVKVEPLSSDTPDVSLATSVTLLSLNIGSSATATITVIPVNGFIGTITLAVSTSDGVGCSINPTYIQTSGTSTLTCNSDTLGDNTATITATGGANPHTTSVTIHVAAVSPAAPSPLTILGLSQAVYFGILGVIIIIVVVETVLLLRRPRALSPKSST